MIALLKLACVAAAIYFAFDVIVFVYTKWTGRSKEHAVRDIRKFLLSENVYFVNRDIPLNQKLWGIVQSVIGDDRFQKMVEASEELCLWNYDETSGVPCLQYSMDITENEKIIIEARMKNQLQKTLALHNLPTKVLIEWSVNNQANMPCLHLYYAETEEQYFLLCAMAKQIHNETPRKGNLLVDKDV